jgi:hypothetical protein
MRIAARLGICTLLLAATASHAAEKDTGTLCAVGERPIFSCPTGKKTISVCASPDLTATAGYLKYRFGRSQQRIELSYPADNAHPRQHFHFHSESFAKGSGEQLSFSIGAFAYIVFVERSVFNFNSSGVLIKSGDKLIARLTCDQERPTPDKLYELDGLGLPAAQYEADVCPGTRPCRG